MDMPMPDYQQLTRIWLDFAARMASGATAAAGETVPGDATRRMRDSYLQALGQYTEEFMRSPQFLEMMRQSTDAAVAMRQQTNDLLAQAHHAAGGLARQDLDSLLMAIRRCETRILDKLDELSARMDAYEQDDRTVKSGDGKPVRKSR
jgi:hypothetical protein